MRDREITSRIMGAIPNRDTRPEMLLRRELHGRGLRYRVRTNLPGRPDIVFPGPRVAVFVDGDYWHGNTWRLRGASSFDAYFAGIANAEFWKRKISGNMRRDVAMTALLRESGWQVIRPWESDIVRDVTAVASQVERLVRTTGTSSRRRPT